MTEYSRVMGDTVRRVRLSLKLTPKRIAEQIKVDEQTIMNIEKENLNPTQDILYPLFLDLKIDSREMFNAKLSRKSEAQYQICELAEICTEEEVTVLIPVIESIRNALCKGSKIENKTKKSLPPLFDREAGSAISTSGSVAYNFFQFYNINQCFSFASGTVQGEF